MAAQHVVLAFGALLAVTALVATGSFLPDSYTLELPVRPVSRGVNWSVGVVEEGRGPVSQTFRALQVWVIPSGVPQEDINIGSGGVYGLGNLTVPRPPYDSGANDGNVTRGFLHEELDPNVPACTPADTGSGSFTYRWTFDTSAYSEAETFGVHIAEMFWTNAEKGVQEVTANGSKWWCIYPPIRNYSIQTVTFVNTTATPTDPNAAQPAATTTTFSFPTSINAYGEEQPADLPSAAAFSSSAPVAAVLSATAAAAATLFF